MAVAAAVVLKAMRKKYAQKNRGEVASSVTGNTAAAAVDVAETKCFLP